MNKPRNNWIRFGWFALGVGLGIVLVLMVISNFLSAALRNL